MLKGCDSYAFILSSPGPWYHLTVTSLWISRSQSSLCFWAYCLLSLAPLWSSFCPRDWEDVWKGEACFPWAWADMNGCQHTSSGMWLKYLSRYSSTLFYAPVILCPVIVWTTHQMRIFKKMHTVQTEFPLMFQSKVPLLLNISACFLTLVKSKTWKLWDTCHHENTHLRYHQNNGD